MSNPHLPYLQQTSTTPPVPKPPGEPPDPPPDPPPDLPPDPPVDPYDPSNPPTRFDPPVPTSDPDDPNTQVVEKWFTEITGRGLDPASGAPLANFGVYEYEGIITLKSKTLEGTNYTVYRMFRDEIDQGYVNSWYPDAVLRYIKK